MLTAADNASRATFTFDSRNWQTSVSNAGTPGLPTVVLSFVFNATGAATSVTDNAGVGFANTFDGAGRLTSRTWSGSSIPTARVDWSYDAAGQWLTQTRSSNAAGTTVVGSSTASYDAVGQMTQLTHRNAAAQSVVAYAYQYDLAGQVTQEQHHGETLTYTHDLVGQLLTATRTVQPSETYTYDAVGNSTAPGTVIGAGNRILSDAQFTYTYDGEGNLTRKVAISNGEVTDYTYDYRNRLTQVTVQSAGGVLLSTARYTYDVFDNVIQRNLNGQVLLTVYNGHHAWADYNAGGQVLARYLYGEQYDELLARWRASDGLAWYLTDRQGTVRDLWRNGTLVGRREFDAFGKIVSTSADGFADRFAFQGREWEAAAGRYWFRARWYDPQQRQFTSEDPLGFGAADANLRRFVFNAPTMYTDPSGTVAAPEYAFLRTAVVAGALIGAWCAVMDAIARGGSAWDVVKAGIAGAVWGAAQALVAVVNPRVGFGLAIPSLYHTVQTPETPLVRFTQFLCALLPGGLGAVSRRGPQPGPTRSPAKVPPPPPATGDFRGQNNAWGGRPAAPPTPSGTPPRPRKPLVEMPPVPRVPPITPKPPLPPITPKPPKQTPEAPTVAEPSAPRPVKVISLPLVKMGGGSCFTAGIPLLTPDGYRLIETLQVGDLVLSRDEHDVTGNVTPKAIEEIFVRSALVLKLHVGRQVIGTTAEHPFFVRDHGWIDAQELWVGAELVGYDGVTTKVEEIESTDEYVVVYNLRIADWHTYFVGADDWGFSVWAHNSGGTCAPKPVNVRDGHSYPPNVEKLGKHIVNPPTHPTSPNASIVADGQKVFRTMVAEATNSKHNYKHLEARTAAEAQSMSRGGAPAQYLPEGDLGGITHVGLEKLTLEKGVVLEHGGAYHAYLEFDQTIGYNNGKPTNWIRAELSGGAYHGHPFDPRFLPPEVTGTD